MWWGCGNSKRRRFAIAGGWDYAAGGVSKAERKRNDERKLGRRERSDALGNRRFMRECAESLYIATSRYVIESTREVARSQYARSQVAGLLFGATTHEMSTFIRAFDFIA